MSFDAPLKEPIQRYIDLLPNVKLIRHKKRSGLIVARMIGARLATAPVIIFLDAHTEVNVGWLEPLLDQLRRNRKQVLQPFIDGIDMKTLTFASPGIYYKGAFSWDLRYICLVSSIGLFLLTLTLTLGPPVYMSRQLYISTNKPLVLRCEILRETLGAGFKMGRAMASARRQPRAIKEPAQRPRRTITFAAMRGDRFADRRRRAEHALQ